MLRWTLFGAHTGTFPPPKNHFVLPFPRVWFRTIPIYIYIYGRPQLVGTFWSKISIFPQFCSKNWPRKTPTKTWGFFMFPSFFFFLLSAFFCLCFLLSLCISTSWSLKRYPPGRVSGIYILYIYIYIYAVVLLSGPSLAFWGVIIWAKFAFLQNHVCQKHYKNRGFSTFFFWKKNCAREFEVLLSGPSWSFLRCSQLGPDNNTYLAQIVTPQNAFFFNFCF